MRRVEAGCRFGSKAQTLLGLSGHLRRGRTLPQHTFTVGEWRADENRVLHDILACEWSSGASLLARSSALHEDGDSGRHAGRYRSIEAAGVAQLSRAVAGVIDSYGHGAGESDEEDSEEPKSVTLEPTVVAEQRYVDRFRIRRRAHVLIIGARWFHLRWWCRTGGCHRCEPPRISTCFR